MSARLKFACALALSAACASVPAASSTRADPTNGRLSVRGQNLVDAAGQPVELRGWNWGRWGAMQPQDAIDNRQQGANVVRIPLRWWGYYDNDEVDSRDDKAVDTAGISPSHLTILDDMVAKATGAGLRIVLFIDSDCGQDGTQTPRHIKYCDPEGRYPDGRNFWSDPDARARFIAVWRFVANRYRNVPGLALFEPLPEPDPKRTSPADLTAFYDEVMRAIRPQAPGVPFLIGGRSYGAKAIDTAWNPQWKDVVYTGNLFLYTDDSNADADSIANFRERMQLILDVRRDHNVPVFVQQIGVRSSEDPQRRALNVMLDAMADHRLGYAYWEYRGSYSPGEYGVHYRVGNAWQVKADWLRDISAHLQR